MKAKSECLICRRQSLNVSATVLAHVMQMKSENLIHMKAKSERLIYRRQSLSVSTDVLAHVMQIKSKHLIHIKAKSERLICCASKCDVDEV